MSTHKILINSFDPLSDEFPNSFVNTGLDEDLSKSIDKGKLTQKEIQVKGKMVKSILENSGCVQVKNLPAIKLQKVKNLPKQKVQVVLWI